MCLETSLGQLHEPYDKMYMQIPSDLCGIQHINAENLLFIFCIQFLALSISRCSVV